MVNLNLSQFLQHTKPLGNLLANFFVKWALYLPRMDQTLFLEHTDMKSAELPPIEWVFEGVVNGKTLFVNYKDPTLILLDEMVYKRLDTF